jgi:hypothetical protein
MEAESFLVILRTKIRDNVHEILEVCFLTGDHIARTLFAILILTKVDDILNWKLIFCLTKPTLKLIIFPINAIVIQKLCKFNTLLTQLKYFFLTC